MEWQKMEEQIAQRDNQTLVSAPPHAFMRLEEEDCVLHVHCGLNMWGLRRDAEEAIRLYRIMEVSKYWGVPLEWWRMGDLWKRHKNEHLEEFYGNNLRNFTIEMWLKIGVGHQYNDLLSNEWKAQLEKVEREGARRDLRILGLLSCHYDRGGHQVCIHD